MSAVAEKLSNPRKKRPMKPEEQILRHRNGAFYAPLWAIQIEDKFNVRKNAEPDEELVNSVSEHGVLNPIHVRWKDDNEDVLYVVDGERRYRAAKIANWKEVPVICRGHLDYIDALVISLTTNEGQLPLTREEKAEGFRRLNNNGLEPWEISNVMACSERMVVETLRLLDKAIAPVRKGVLVKGDITMRAGSRAALLPSSSQEKISPKIAGKTSEEALSIIREEEKKLGIVPKGTRLKTVSSKKGSEKGAALRPIDVVNRLRKVEKFLKEDSENNPSSRTTKAQLRLCEVLRGEKPLKHLNATSNKPKSPSVKKRKFNGR